MQGEPSIKQGGDAERSAAKKPGHITVRKPIRLLDHCQSANQKTGGAQVIPKVNTDILSDNSTLK